MADRGESAVRLVSVYPDLLGTYGDAGNVAVLAHRAARRGLAVEVVDVQPGEPVPEGGDVYLLGGGEDEAQRAATELLGTGGLRRAVDTGAAVLAVCAGLQVLGMSFTGSDDRPVPGVGVLDVTTSQRRRRAVGELLAEPIEGIDLPVLTGFENHGGGTALGPAARPLARVVHGVGNGAGDGTEGVLQGRIIGTYLHGPVLARNPALADRLLTMVVGPLDPLDDPHVDALRAQRLAAVGGPGNRWTRLVARLGGRTQS